MLELAGLGLGTAPLGGLYEPVDDDTAHAVVERAWHLGIRYFDTAPYYGSGNAERRLGAALRERPRDEFVVSTKVGRLLRPGESGWHGAPTLEAYFDFSHDAALRSLEASLERLGLDRVDIALVHDPDDHYDEALAGAFRALARLRDEGVVRAVGVGMNRTALLCRFAREANPDCFLVAGRYTLLDRSAGDELLPLCAEHGIAVIAGGVFNSGVLAGGNTFDYQAASPSVVARAAELRETCARFGVPLAAAAVQFPPRNDAVACVLVGCRTPAEVEEDVRLFELDLPSGLWDELV
ncbi:MAG TPA: aldo/keto reductase [Gaiellaceae bacterium]|nr:aldo/keto reductase [Gaiellaceae bacterium]